MTKRTKIVAGVAAAVFLLTGLAAATGVYYLVSFYQGRVLFDEGYAAMKRPDYDTAIVKFRGALQKKLVLNYRAYAFENLAFSENGKGQHDEAIRDYTESLRIDPTLAFAYS